MCIARMPSSRRWPYKMSAATRENLRPQRDGIQSVIWKKSLDGNRSSSGLYMANLDRNLESWKQVYFLRPLTQLRDRIKGAVASCRRNPNKLIRQVYTWLQINLTISDPLFCQIICLCWRRNPYDNSEEFWVEVRTTGLVGYQETQSERETHHQASHSGEASSWPILSWFVW